MTEPRHARKQAVRDRMARTGEKYTQANTFLARQHQRAAEAAADGAPVEPTDDELNLLIGEYLHLQSHVLGPAWTVVDRAAYATSRVLLQGLESVYTSAALTQVNVRLNLVDTAHACASDRSRELPAYAYTGSTDLTFKIHKHREGTDTAYGCEFSASTDRLMIALALYGGAMKAEPLLEEPLDEAPEGTVRMRETVWEVEEQAVSTECRRSWRTDPHAEGGFVIEEDTAPQYLSPWEREAGWLIPPGGTWVDAVQPSSPSVNRPESTPS
jgi:hypothetical protein